MQERRRNVRVRPTAEYRIGVDYGTGVVKARLAVLDVAVGGVALVLTEALAGLTPGAQIRLEVSLPGVPRFETVGTLCYTQGRVGGRCGIHFDHLTPEHQGALSRAVSELLERGSSA
jgi:c-di-GMP-binding flagellar brake protein YcgR